MPLTIPNMHFIYRNPERGSKTTTSHWGRCQMGNQRGWRGRPVADTTGATINSSVLEQQAVLQEGHMPGRAAHQSLTQRGDRLQPRPHRPQAQAFLYGTRHH